VDDIQKAYAWLVSQNVKTEGEPNLVAKMPDHDLWLAGFRDSEGNVMQYMSEVPH
jgi:methylmalonyl-CoA/ethylmalonyl-CoA epimerase